MIVEEINNHVKASVSRAIREENCKMSTWCRKKPKKPIKDEDVGKEIEEVKVVV